MIIYQKYDTILYKQLLNRTSHVPLSNARLLSFSLEIIKIVLRRRQSRNRSQWNNDDNNIISFSLHIYLRYDVIPYAALAPVISTENNNAMGINMSSRITAEQLVHNHGHAHNYRNFQNIFSLGSKTCDYHHDNSHDFRHENIRTRQRRHLQR